MKRIVIFSALLLATGCNQPAIQPQATDVESSAATSPAAAVPKTWIIEEVATTLRIPWDIAFLPDGRMLVTERPGAIKIVKDGAVTDLGGMPAVTSRGESGLTGIAVDPGFAANGYIYLYYSYQDGGLLNRVSRFVLDENGLRDEAFIVDALPGGRIHNGGRLRFGPDGKLWMLAGDAARPEEAQSMDSLGGKVLRVNADGSIADDNPFPGSPIYSLGHRNPQGLAWDPVSGDLLVTEHGQSAHDEVNVLEAGANYGWPLAQRCASSQDDHRDPLLCSGTTTWAPSGIAFVGDGSDSSFVIAGLRGSFLRRYRYKDGKAELLEDITSSYGRLRAVTTGPDGSLYVSTSNRDGRGRVRNGDDRILRITYR